MVATVHTVPPPHALIVHAHPGALSFNAALRDTARSTLESAGWTVTVSDLYAQGFRAEAGPGDFASPPVTGSYSLLREQRRASAEASFAEAVAREQERLRRADLLLLQFPLWWYSVPAVLKGWFDRVLAHGFAYDVGRLAASGARRHAGLRRHAGAAAVRVLRTRRAGSGRPPRGVQALCGAPHAPPGHVPGHPRGGRAGARPDAALIPARCRATGRGSANAALHHRRLSRAGGRWRRGTALASMLLWVAVVAVSSWIPYWRG